MSGPATAASYEESVGSCGPPTPHTPPTPAAPRSAPVRRQLDFTGAGDLEDDDDEEFLCRVADDIERGYSEAKQRTPKCICGRHVCAVELDKQSGRWKYVCSSLPKCKHVAFCEEVDLDPKSLPTSRSHPKLSNPYAFNDPSNPCAFNNPSNHMPGSGTPVKVGPQVTGAITPVNVHPQVAGATTLFIDSPQGAGATTLVNVSPHGERTATPAKFFPRGVGTATPPKVSPQGARSKFGRPICQCTAGECREIKIGKEDWYVCHIPKGKGACNFMVLVKDFASAHAAPCNEVNQEFPSMLQQPIATVNTPSKSPMRPQSTPIPFLQTQMAPAIRGHGTRDCPNQSPGAGMASPQL